MDKKTFEMEQSLPNETIGWTRFSFIEKTPSGKTEVWLVYHKNTNEELGKIKWNSKWRQYWMEIVDAGFTKGCLRDVATFLEKLMEKHNEIRNT